MPQDHENHVVIEKLIESWGLTASSLMASSSWWRRALGLVLACVALWCIVVLAAVWVLVGKKPKSPPLSSRDTDRRLH
jgi:hypothetical protein